LHFNNPEKVVDLVSGEIVEAKVLSRLEEM
jgi:hypothetical protein